jgi:WD40 repeat protein
MANDDMIYEVDKAHDGPIWDMAWHPMGNCLATAGNDAYLQLWGRAKPGEELTTAEMIKENRENEQMTPAAHLSKMSYINPKFQARMTKETTRSSK